MGRVCLIRRLVPTAAKTILEAVVQALRRDGVPRTAGEIHQLVVDRSLFTFRAQAPVGILRSALRKHLASHGAEGQPPARVRQIDRDSYVLA
jgi:hypothetical protein